MAAASTAVHAITWQGEPAWRLHHASGARATLAQHGAHLLSWCSADGSERLYLSPATRHGAGQAVRGGVPVIFPQFAQRGPDTSLPRHGFARTRAWQPVHVGVAGDSASVTLRLSDDEATRALWPQRFELDLTVRLGAEQLGIELACRNMGRPGSGGFAFSAALHSYFAVDRIEATVLGGLQGTRCLDTTNGREHVEPVDALAFDGAEIDRIHWAAGARPLVLAQADRRLRIEATGLPDVVVWNPGAAKAAQLSDLTPGDERRFVCVEAAAIEPPIHIAPGAHWHGEQLLTVLS
jgi:glucose-6-phosphate 1-epimerase